MDAVDLDAVGLDAVRLNAVGLRLSGGSCLGPLLILFDETRRGAGLDGISVGGGDLLVSGVNVDLDPTVFEDRDFDEIEGGDEPMGATVSDCEWRRLMISYVNAG